MSVAPNFPHTPLSDVFVRLGAGLKAGVTVVTPNRRLALALKREFDRSQAERGLDLWDTADILPFSAFLERSYTDALYSGQAAALPALLTAAQEQVLWEQIIRRTDPGALLLAVPQTARLAREAWQLAHAWRLLPRLKNFPLNEDGKAFQDWSQQYARATFRARQTDGARLCDLVAGSSGPVAGKPACLVCYGFDRIPPQQAALLQQYEAAGCEVLLARAPPRAGGARRVVCADSRDEIRRAAAWVRARLEANGNARIGIVVPQLAHYRGALLRGFGAAMEPDVRQALPGSARRTLPFNLSLGVALTEYPLVSDAFSLLELAGREIDFERASRLLRSPFIAGGETEMAARARLDARLRKRAEPAITLEQLLALSEREHGGTSCPILMLRLAALAAFRKAHLSAAQAPSTWAKAISEALQIAGFPGERGLDSAEYQTLKKWHAVIADFAALDRVVLRDGYGEAVARLRRIAAETLFQPETPEVPIQILGVLEAAGMEFDHLWVLGLSDEVWPPQPHPNPFLPIELQRAAGLPQGSAAAALELARLLTGEWLTCADEVVLSHPRRSDERDAHELAPSPLIVHITEHESALPDQASHRELIRAAGRLERSRDDSAPALAAGQSVSGGTAVIKNHAACPFRALALHRLGAEGLETPHTGLDAAERGTLVHRVLAQVWEQLKCKSALDAIGADELDALLQRAAAEAIARMRRERPSTLSGRFAQIEQQRLGRLAREWLGQERNRGDFTVAATEEKRQLEIGGLALSARLDRVDQLADGRRIVIDYKTGLASAGAWLGERPDEPQLPLYLVAAEPEAAALAFAQVRAGRMQFTALARAADLLPGARTLPDNKLRHAEASWDKQIGAWRSELIRIAAGFSGGAARVDPKHPQTCRHCDLQPFCRIHERAGGGFVGEEPGHA